MTSRQSSSYSADATIAQWWSVTDHNLRSVSISHHHHVPQYVLCYVRCLQHYNVQPGLCHLHTNQWPLLDPRSAWLAPICVCPATVRAHNMHLPLHSMHHSVCTICNTRFTQYASVCIFCAMCISKCNPHTIAYDTANYIVYLNAPCPWYHLLLMNPPVPFSH